MAEDLINVRLSTKASEIAEQILESDLFEDRVAICKFAFAYAVKNHFDDMDPEKIDNLADSSGVNYNIGTLDGDKFLSQLIISLYPTTTTPYRYIRALMIFGLERLGERLIGGTFYPINKLM